MCVNFLNRLLVVVALVVLGASVASADESPCKRVSEGPEKLLVEIRDKDKLEKIHEDAMYIAFQDKKTYATWTFTQETHSAHPAVVCRQPKTEGDTITLLMEINCKGAQYTCEQLERDFKLLNQRASAQANEQQQ